MLSVTVVARIVSPLSKVRPDLDNDVTYFGPPYGMRQATWSFDGERQHRARLGAWPQQGGLASGHWVTAFGCPLSAQEIRPELRTELIVSSLVPMRK